jgi:hypothetical protein
MVAYATYSRVGEGEEDVQFGGGDHDVDFGDMDGMEEPKRGEGYIYRYKYKGKVTDKWVSIICHFFLFADLLYSSHSFILFVLQCFVQGAKVGRHGVQFAIGNQFVSKSDAIAAAAAGNNFTEKKILTPNKKKMLKIWWLDMRKREKYLTTTNRAGLPIGIKRYGDRFVSCIVFILVCSKLNLVIKYLFLLYIFWCSLLGTTIPVENCILVSITILTMPKQS